MSESTILDDGYEKDFNDLLLEDSSLEWKGNPKPKFSISFLELGGDVNVMSGPMSIFGVIVGFTFYFVYSFYTAGNIFGAFFSFILGSFLFVLPDIIKNRRKSYTKYAFSKDRLYFQLWRYGKFSTHIVRLEDANGFTYEEYVDGYGIIHITPKTSFDFFTHDFIAGKKRFYPTFEDIPEVMGVYKKLNSNLRAFNKNGKSI